jgi:hypothetical protein
MPGEITRGKVNTHRKDVGPEMEPTYARCFGLPSMDHPAP